MRLVSLARALMLAISLTIAPCCACSMVYSTVRVGRDFRVKVEHGGRPVGGLHVELYRGGDTKSVVITDNSGFALFRSLQPGSYYLRARLDAGIPNGPEVLVKAGGPRDVTIPLRWPGTSPILVRALRGRIRGPSSGQSQQRLSLDLVEAISGRTLKSLVTSDHGDFDLAGRVPGLYFLRLKPSGLLDGWGQQIVGLIAVSVDNRARSDHLDIDLGATSCGLWYLDQSKCPRNELRIGQLAGQVIDGTGAAIGNAQVVLYDRTERLVDDLRSDSAGRFASPRQLAGPYELVVSAAGFTPLRRTLQLQSSASALNSQLSVELGIGGTCSNVHTR